MKNLFTFYLLLCCSFSLTAQLRLNVQGNAKISGHLDLTSSGVANLFIGLNAGTNTTGDLNVFIGRNTGSLNSSGIANTFIGVDAGKNNTLGLENTFLGQQAGLMNVEGNNNTFLGEDAGRSNTASSNTFVGSKAGSGNTTGFANTFIGRYAGFRNTDRSGLVAVGDSALYNNGIGALISSFGIENTAVGSKAGYSNTVGSNNTFIGHDVGYSNTVGFSNTFLGNRVGFSNTTGSGNTFSGSQTGRNNTTGFNNTFSGYLVGLKNTTGSNNTFSGSQAGLENTTGVRNTFSGNYAGSSNTTGNELTAFGYLATASFLPNTPINNAFVIGSHGLMTSSHSGMLGNITMQKITGYVNFGTASDGRMKTKVREDVHGLDFILRLRPVSYQVDALKLDKFLRQGMEEVSAGKVDQSTAEKAQAQERQQIYEGYLREKSAIRYTGFIAQEVEKAMTESDFEFSGLVQPAHEKDHYSLRYAEFVVPLVKGMQEQQELIKEQERENQEQQQQIDELKILVEQLLAEKQETPKGELYQLNLKQKAMLAQNRPNPFLDHTTIDYFIPGDVQKALIQVTAADGKILGRVTIQETGKGQVNIKTDTYPAGAYFYSLLLDGQVFETKRMVLTN